MWDERASRARRQIAALAPLGLGVTDLHTAAMPILDRTVGCELTCWATIDPETLVISTMVSGKNRVTAEYER
ncbi:MAG: helix-turn-helix transcriptional regulator, partial [Actinomycetes bacterium]